MTQIDVGKELVVFKHLNEVHSWKFNDFLGNLVVAEINHSYVLIMMKDTLQFVERIHTELIVV